MGLQSNIDAVRGDIKTHAQNFFIEFLSKKPQYEKFFPAYQGKSAAELKALPKFVDHTEKVVTELLRIMERSGDPSNLKADAIKMVNAPQHAPLGTSHFEGLFEVLVPFLQNTLKGQCATAEWQSAGAALVAEMKKAGMKSA